MKKNIVIFSGILSILSLTAFGFMDRNNEVVVSPCSAIDKESTVENKNYVDFFYSMGTRFQGVKKQELNKAKSITDFLPKEQTDPVVTYKLVSVIILENDRETLFREYGTNEILTDAQLKLLQSADYSTNFFIRADFLEKDDFTGKLYENYFSPYLTVVPEKEARYLGAENSLIEYITKHNKENTANLDETKLRPAKLYFTINKEGKLSNVKLDRSSGYSVIDEKIIELLHEAPGKWEPAENTQGEKVNQELVISFGMVGC